MLIGKALRRISRPAVSTAGYATTVQPRPRLKYGLADGPALGSFLIKERKRAERRDKERHEALDDATEAIPTFSHTLLSHGLERLRRGRSTVLQINIGKFCNLNCRHCHVESGPTKLRENMSIQTVERCLDVLEASPAIDTVDITGGAPELNPYFRHLVIRARALGKTVIDRCNLAVLFENGQEDLPEFLADQGVNVVASLPCYTPDNTDLQRGKRVFDDSITALRVLNQKGFGSPAAQDSACQLRLDLVYNPVGASLPPPQADLEATYKQRLWDDHKVTFNSLLAITNMPIKRFADDLYQTGQYAAYMQILANAFNSSTVDGLMCRNTVNVAWDGKIYDCDFNAALDLGCRHMSGKETTSSALDVYDIDDYMELEDAAIRTGKHCFGCTAGSGSSCGGTLA